ncbi:hypothetical protein TSUD_94200 [Trifolium subterraneum]|uniref:Uncharacterized protein n=1 Tax=Trifolium subterraneum TaxID=3900 RepID=A0A2Z6PBD1_TRISU|nr:hypothetical protein TSUD_94200 [Trifolium subterraneum]
MTEGTFYSITKQNDEHYYAPIEEMNVDSRIDEYISDEEKKAEKLLSLETRIKFEKPKSNGEFITIQLDNNPTKTVKIEANLPHQVQESLTKGLKAKSDILATTPEEMPGIDPAVV